MLPGMSLTLTPWSDGRSIDAEDGRCPRDSDGVPNPVTAKTIMIVAKRAFVSMPTPSDQPVVELCAISTSDSYHRAVSAGNPLASLSWLGLHAHMEIVTLADRPDLDINLPSLTTSWLRFMFED
jgi:hypothetical protein